MILVSLDLSDFVALGLDIQLLWKDICLVQCWLMKHCYLRGGSVRSTSVTLGFWVGI